MSSDEWRVVYSRSEDVEVEGVTVPPAAIKCKWNLWPPYTMVDDAMWAFWPFGRVAPGDDSLQRIQVVEPRIRFYDERYRSSSDHLQYVPAHDTLVFGNQYSLWLFKMGTTDAER